MSFAAAPVGLARALEKNMLFLWLLYILWGLPFIGWVIYIIKTNKHAIPLVYYTVIPFFSFIIFSYVFVLNNVSPVAQMSQSQSLWSFWVHAWTPLLVLNFFNTAGSLIVLLLPPYPPREWKLFIFRLLIFFTTALSLFHIYIFFPSA